MRRSNTDIFEELQAADITRECIDERCVFEEAREYYEDDAKTRSFWNKQTRKFKKKYTRSFSQKAIKSRQITSSDPDF